MKRGFTIVEAFFASWILLIAIATPLAIISRNITQAGYARDESIATFLTQEAYEITRHVRDNSLIVNSTDPVWNPVGIDQCISVNGASSLIRCVVNARTSTLTKCQAGQCDISTGADLITFNTSTGLYENTIPAVSGSDITTTPFLRTITIERAAAPADNRELWVTVTTTWKETAIDSSTRSIVLRGILLRD